VPKQAAHDLPKLASLVQTARAGVSLPIRTVPCLVQLQTRSYATETVKKAVKAKAAAGKSVAKTTTEKKKPAAKRATKKKTATATKKKAPKKTKKKAAAPKKKVKAKKPVRVLTEDEKLRQEITELRKLALKGPPRRRALSAFNCYLSDNVKAGGTTEGQRAALAEISGNWKTISPAEREKYNHIAAERTEARAAEYKAWVESYTPDEIRLANNARLRLKKRLIKRSALNGPRKVPMTRTQTQHIEDERRVKRPSSAWTHFFSERVKSTDFKGIALQEKSRLIADEWRALSGDEKQRFVDQASADKQRYVRETSV